MNSFPRRGRPAFTLIEMMAVVTIIIILAALVVGGLGFVNERQAREKAKVQIALLSKALEDFKLDYGFYPPAAKSGSGANATVSPRNNVDPVTSANAITQSRALYQALYWDTDFDGVGAAKADGSVDDADQKTYLPQLDPGTTANPNKQGWINGTGSNAYIIDPWGNPYAYRSGTQANGSAFNKAQNPDFDLWSWGKDGATRPDVPADKKNNDDVKNF